MINRKKKRCLGCDTGQFLFGKGLCTICYRKQLKSPKKGQRINLVSKKQSSLNRQYLKLREKYLLDNPVCEARLEGCTSEATEIHHTCGRIGELLLNISYFKALCRSCHTWVETHPIEAKELGLSKSRLIN